MSSAGAYHGLNGKDLTADKSAMVFVIALVLLLVIRNSKLSLTTHFNCSCN
jgi:hypothetical protein